MPRPKRTKVGPAATATSRPVSGNSSRKIPLKTAEAIQDESRYDSISSDSDGLVRRKAPLRKTGRTPLQMARGEDRHQDHEATMSGALRGADEANAHREDSFLAIVAQEREADYSRHRKAAEQDNLKQQLVESGMEAQARRSGRTRHSVVHNTATGQVDRVTESFTVSQDQSAKPAAAAPPPSAQKSFNTPSFLRLGKFAKRPRANSLLSMAQAAAASRENSTLGYGDEAALETEDEDTILTLGGLSAKVTPTGKNMPNQSSSSRKRKRGNDGPEPEPDVLVPSSQSPPSSPPARTSQRFSLQPDNQPRRTSARTNPPQLLVKETVLDDGEPSPAEPALPAPRSTRTSMRSTTSMSKQPTTPPRKRSVRTGPRGKRRIRDPSPVVGTSPLSTPSSSPQHTAPVPPAADARPPKKTRAAKQPQRPTLTTQALKAMLPRRAQRSRRTPFSILSDEDAVGSEDDTPSSEGNDNDDDVDELSRPARRRRPISAISGNTVSSNAKGKAAQKGKTNETTYARARPAADKENAAYNPSHNPESPDADQGTATLAKKGSKIASSSLKNDLAAAAAKFAEVDDWEMSFESVDGGGESSPWR